MMKKSFIAWLCAGLCLHSIAFAASEYRLQSGFSYQSWSSDQHESGSQLYIPLQVGCDDDRFSWEIKTGYADTRGDLSGDSEQSVTGMLDTQAGVSYLLPTWGGIDWLAGLDINLPTGRTNLDERKVRVMIDPDLVSIISPGQGFNVNPTLSAARSWERWTMGVGLGYAFQGKYDYSRQTPDYDPGDILSVAGQVDYGFSDLWKLSLIAQYLTMGTDRVGGADLLQKGDAWLIGTTLTRSEDKWDLALSVQGIFRGKARILGTGGNLVTELQDSQGDEWIAGVSGRYQWLARTSFTAGLQYLFLAKNGYDPVSPYYMGNRRKLSLSLGWLQQLGNNLDLQCGLAGFIMADDPSWLHPDGDRLYKGWSVTAAVTKRF